MAAAQGGAEGQRAAAVHAPRRWRPLRPLHSPASLLLSSSLLRPFVRKPACSAQHPQHPLATHQATHPPTLWRLARLVDTQSGSE